MKKHYIGIPLAFSPGRMDVSSTEATAIAQALHANRVCLGHAHIISILQANAGRSGAVSFVEI